MEPPTFVDGEKESSAFGTNALVALQSLCANVLETANPVAITVEGQLGLSHDAEHVRQEVRRCRFARGHVLMLEGTVAFRSQSTRHLDSRAEGRAAVPFALHAHAVGHGSRGREKVDRGEQWMPLWRAPTSWLDLSALLAEGRAQEQRSHAVRPLDFAQAVAKLGVARGICSFERYGYLERNGQSNIAVPLGRVDVVQRTHASLVEDTAAWLDRLQRQVRDDSSSVRMTTAEGSLSDAVYACLTADSAPSRWQTLLVHAAKIEALQATGTGFQAGPIPRLSPGWLTAGEDGSPEWRLAAALASAASEHRATRPIDGVRAHFLPLDASKARYAVREKRLVKDLRVVAMGRDALTDLTSLVERRLMEAAQAGQRCLPLVAAAGRGAQLADLAALLDGRVDIERTVWLARALMAIDWRRVRGRAVHAPDLYDIDEAWVALRLVGLPYRIAGRQPPLDLAAVRRILSGDVAAGMANVLRRLQAAGYRPPLRSATTDPQTGRRWIAALAFPIEPSLGETLASTFLAPSDRSQNQETS